MQRRRILLPVVLVLMGFVAVAAVSAGTWVAGTVSFNCTGVVGTGVSVTLDRDNTGSGQEAYIIQAVDGAGTVLGQISSSAALASGYTISGLTYTTAPQYNPITFRFISQAGNGLAEQLIYSASGSCAGLPTYDAAPAPAGDGCSNPLPAGFRVQSIPAGALAYFEPDEASYTGFNIPPGTWYAGSAEDGFVEVWIACEAANIFVPAANVTG